MLTSKFIRFWYGRKITKFDFFVERCLFAISQLHTMVSSLLGVNSSELIHTFTLQPCVPPYS